jgi:hypothetical protein
VEASCRYTQNNVWDCDQDRNLLKASFKHKKLIIKFILLKKYYMHYYPEFVIVKFFSERIMKSNKLYLDSIVKTWKIRLSSPDKMIV